MQEILAQILGYLKGIWNKRWQAMLIAWFVSLAGWGGVYLLPDQFESKAKIYIDTQSLLKPLLKGLTVETNVDHQINLMVRTLLTRPNVEKIIRLSDLDLRVNSDSEFDGLVKQLQKKIKFASKRRTNKNVYDLSYEDRSPETAQVVLQSVITVFIENTIGESKEESVSARNFLKNQIKEYEKRLLKSENKLKDFKQKNVGMLPSAGGKDYYARMEQAKSTLDESKLNLKEAKRRKDAIQKELNSFVASLKSSGSGIATSFDDRIDSLNTNLDDLLLNYTDSHPDVLSIRRVLDNLVKKQQKELIDLKKSASGNSGRLSLNPLYQELKINLGVAKAEVESLIVREAEYQARYEKQQHLVNTVPEIEAQLVALNRDYHITKDKYEEFLKRRESASIAESVDQTTESVQFKVIEAPRVEYKAVGPNRILYSSGVLFLALGAGLGFSFLLSQVRPVVMSGRQMAQLTGLPILGSVSAVVSPAQRTRRALMVISYFSLFAMLLVSYGVLMGWYIISSAV